VYPIEDPSRRGKVPAANERTWTLGFCPSLASGQDDNGPSIDRRIIKKRTT
jgi:hypothetical protein